MRKIPGFSKYLIDSQGNLYSTFRGKKPLKAHPDWMGYLHVGLIDDQGKRKNMKVHKLVAITFLGNHNGPILNHKDGDKQNNHLNNLEYVTYSDNINHAYRNGLRKHQPAYEVKCPVCNGEFKSKPSRPRTFCSRSCYLETVTLH